MQIKTIVFDFGEGFGRIRPFSRFLFEGTSVSDLFSEIPDKKSKKSHAPLADRMRPKTLDDFFGQRALLKEGSSLRKMLEEDKVPSLIFWGPPGSGKTTLARIVAHHTKKQFYSVSAVAAGIGDVKKIMQEARFLRETKQQGCILFIDEIHRFNKAQQDYLLPFVEEGTVTFLGATTENPSFEVIHALLSRCQVFVLEALTQEDIERILDRALTRKEGLGEQNLTIEQEARQRIAFLAQGDARYALNLLEMSASLVPQGAVFDTQVVEKASRKKSLLYDRAGEEHFNIISALHKSMRGSDVQAALYWLGRMLEAGEDPIYVARRVVRFASEDIGVADPQALVLSMSAMQACHLLGMPECSLALAQAVVYCATAPKSNSLYVAYGKVRKEIELSGNPPVPLHIRNAPTDLMKDLGYGKDYRYPHDEKEKFVACDYLPDKLVGKTFYQPGEYGFEREIKKRLEYWQNLKRNLRENAHDDPSRENPKSS